MQKEKMSKMSNEAFKVRRNPEVWEFFLVLKHSKLPQVIFEGTACRVTGCHRTVSVILSVLVEVCLSMAMCHCCG